MIPAPVMAFFSMPDTILILVIALLLFGPKNLPKMARGIGKSMEEFRRAAREIETEIMKEPDPTTPPPPPPPTSETPALTEGSSETEQHYSETGEEYPGHEAEAAAVDTAPVVVADAPVTLPSEAAPAATVDPAVPAPASAAPASAAALPPAAPAVADPPAAAQENPPAEKKTDANPPA